MSIEDRTRSVVKPLKARQTHATLDAKTFKFEVDVGPSGSSKQTYDNKYTVTDAGVAAGETWNGQVGEVMVDQVSGSSPVKRLLHTKDRNCLQAVSDWLYYSHDGFGAPAEAAEGTAFHFNDGIPTTEVEKHGYFTMLQNLPPGKYLVTIRQHKATDEWGGASAYSCNVGVRASSVYGPQPTLYTAVKAWAAPSEAEVKLGKCTGFYFGAITNMTKIVIGDTAYEDAELEDLKREWLEMKGKDRTAAYETDLGVRLSKPEEVTVVFSAAQTQVFVTEFSFGLKGGAKRPRRRQPRKRRPKKRKPRSRKPRKKRPKRRTRREDVPDYDEDFDDDDDELEDEFDDEDEEEEEDFEDYAELIEFATDDER